MLQILTLHRVKQEAHENSPGEQNLEKGGGPNEKGFVL